MALPNGAGGYQVGDGNLSEVQLITQAAPPTATATATLTVAQITGGILLGSPGSSAAAYTLPAVTTLEATVSSAKNNSAFDFSVCNVDGSSSGVITMTAGTGWTIVGLATIAATAGTTGAFRARKTGDGTWTLYRLA
jgi:predicted hotdog family 3-hydroxylacyl-ACP dehydratase